MDVFGREKIALGSDYPFPLGELEPGRLIAASSYDTDTCDWLTRRSALAWLGREPAEVVKGQGWSGSGGSGGLDEGGE
jgi:aminocarboxymuconate-semialdehyde decarboxylase